MHGTGNRILNLSRITSAMYRWYLDSSFYHSRAFWYLMHDLDLNLIPQANASKARQPRRPPGAWSAVLAVGR